MNMPWDRGVVPSTKRIHRWVNLTLLKLNVINLRDT